MSPRPWYAVLLSAAVLAGCSSLPEPPSTPPGAGESPSAPDPEPGPPPYGDAHQEDFYWGELGPRADDLCPVPGDAADGRYACVVVPPTASPE